MSGPTAQQTELGDAQLEAYQQAAQLTQAQYANQQAIYGPMVSQFHAIYAKGPNQQGFSPAETANLNAQAVEGTAENYESAARAVGESEAAQGGGTNPLPTGAQSAVQSNIATSAAEEESSQENQIVSANYNQGYNEWEAAGEGLQSIAAGENPLGFESAETGAGSAAGTTAAQIASEDNSWINAAIGAGATLGGAAIGKIPCWIAAELWGGWNEPRVTLLRAWMIRRADAGCTARCLLRIYLKFGRRIADMMRRRPALRRTMDVIFSWMLRRAQREVQR
jgi:hypothetical protein